MAMNIFIDNTENQTVNIKVIGVGGGGGNAVNRMVASGIKSVEFVAINTDNQALRMSQATQKLQIGERLTHGNGVGGDPERGRQAAEENREEIKNLIKDAQMVFITAGMGGGTGTGAAPVIASIAKELGILTVGIVTKPFNFERARRMQQAEAGIAELAKSVDSLVVIPNERLKLLSEQRITLASAFLAADEVLRQGVQAISDLINLTGLINLDFQDVVTVMKDAGYAHMGVGHASGKGKAVEAAHQAISSPLLETSINGARGVIVNFTVPQDIGLDEIDEAATAISEAAHPDCNLIWGAAFSDEFDDEMSVTVIATGFDSQPGDRVFNRSVPDFNQRLNEVRAQPETAPAAAETAPAAEQNEEAAPEDDSPIEPLTFTRPTAPLAAAPAAKPAAPVPPVSPARPRPSRFNDSDDTPDYSDLLTIFNKH